MNEKQFLKIMHQVFSGDNKADLYADEINDFIHRAAFNLSVLSDEECYGLPYGLSIEVLKLAYLHGIFEELIGIHKALADEVEK